MRLNTSLSNWTVGIAALLTGIALGGATPLWALDLFGTGGEKQEAAVQLALADEQAGALPSLRAVVKKDSPAVVNISTTQASSQFRRRRPPTNPWPGPSPHGGDDPFEEFFRRFFGDRPPPGRQRSLGSGFIISEDGYIITNYHVVGEADKITIKLSDKGEYQAEVVGADEKTDIALIKIKTNNPLPWIPLGDSSALHVGDWVLAIGNPFGLEQTVTVGIVSAKGRVIGAGPYDDFIQTDASINPGNSGGPLLNLKGEVVGINSAIFSQSGGNIGIGFAIPIDLAKPIVAQLRDSGKVTRGWLGVAIQSITPELAKSFELDEAKGALVAEVTKDGPAEKAGIKRGDIISAFKGKTVEDSHDLPSLVAQSPVGDKAAVSVLREGKKKSFTVTLGELPDDPAKAESGDASKAGWGMTVANISDETARRFQIDREQKGVVITAVESGSPAEQAGIQPGDVIEEINRQPVTSVEAFTKALANAKNQETLLLLARRGNFSSFFALRKQ
jgi:serine protease Do